MIRPATAADVPDLVRLIRQLADFQGHLEDAVLTEADLSSALFPRDDSAPVHAHVAEADDRVVGMAIWFTSFSTWTGRRGIWLEDLFIEEAYRGRGLGVGLMTALARECARLGYPAWSGTWRRGTRARSRSTRRWAPGTCTTNSSTACPTTPCAGSRPAPEHPAEPSRRTEAER